MDANEGVQSFNFEVGQKFKSFMEFESQLKHYQDATFIQMNWERGKEEGRASKALLIFIGKRKFLMSYSVL